MTTSTDAVWFMASIYTYTKGRTGVPNVQPRDWMRLIQSGPRLILSNIEELEIIHIYRGRDIREE